MNKRKITTLLLVVLLIGIIAIGATLAYFTDSDEAGNVVEMGHVDISLTETTESDKATVIGEDGIVFSNVLPGDTVSKVPTVTVADDSADCYIRVSVSLAAGEDSRITDEELALLKTQLVDSITNDGKWAYNSAEDLFYYTEKILPGGSADIFQTVKIPSAWKNNVAGQSFSIVLKAEAIQASYISFDSTNICWEDEDGNDLTGMNAVEIQKYTK